MELSKRTMRAKALAIAGALSVVSIALPLSAKAHENAEEWFIYTSGAFATLCGLHSTDAISTEIVHEYQKSWLIPNEKPEILRAMNDAIDELLNYKTFKDCPLRRY